MIITLSFNMKGGPEVYSPKVLLTRLALYQESFSLLFFSSNSRYFFFKETRQKKEKKIFLLQAVSVEIHLYFFTEATLCK